ncbi:MAG TPA: formylmethanofuran dehydrogenase subunit B [Gemmataceae bacterium]
MKQRIDDVACTVCGCVCDDLQITVEGECVTRAEGACKLAEPWYLSQGNRHPPLAEMEGQSVALETALDRAADILRTARAPLIYGLSRSNTEGQQAAIALADRLGAIVDTTASLGHAPAILALQEAGESTCSLGEVRNRADLVIFWGSDPVESHPRHFERYAVDPVGEFLPGGRTDRTIVVVDVRPTASSERADVFLQVEPGRDFEVLWALRGLIRGQEPEPGAIVGAPLDRLRDLAQRMKACRCGIAFFGLGLSRTHLGHRSVEALLRLVTDLNDYTRFYARRMRVSSDVTGADSVLAWQTGYPFSVSLARGYPRFNPGEFTGHDLLLCEEVDACLLVGSFGLRRFAPEALAHLRRIPTIVLDPPTMESLTPPTVRITTAIPGVHVEGTAYRMDEIPIPLRKLLPTHYPSDAAVLQAIVDRLRSN